MQRKIIVSAVTFALLAAAVLALLVYQASPGPQSQDILGLTLGRSDGDTGIAFLSGRRLRCVPEAEPPYTSTCRVTIAGKPLTIRAYRNGPAHLNQIGGGCEAIYAAQNWPCEISSRHVHVHWFAHISEPLGLDAAQMETLRQHCFFENLPEEPILYGTLIAPFAVTLLFVIGLFAWRRPSNKYGWVSIAGLGLLTFCGVFFFALRLTSGFWD